MKQTRKSCIAPLVLVVFLASFVAAQDTEEEGEFILGGEDEGITVSASAQTPSLVRVITKEEIQSSGAKDIAALLQEQAGVGVVRYGPYGNQADITMRGFDSQRIAFLIDGVPVSSPVSGGIDLSFIDVNAIERIEIIYGGSDSKYNASGALGGTVNIVSAKEEEEGIRVEVGIANTSNAIGEYYSPKSGNMHSQVQDLFDGQNIALSFGAGDGDLNLSASLFANRAGNHFLFEDSYGRTLRRVGNEVFDGGLSTSLVIYLPNYAKLSASSLVYYGDKNIPSSGISEEAEKQIDFSTRESVSFEVQNVFAGKVSAQASLSHNLFSRKYGEASKYDYNVITLINRVKYYPVHYISSSLGLELRAVHLNSSNMGEHKKADGALSLGAEYRPLKNLIIVPSIKAVFTGSSSVPLVIIPKLGISWQIFEGLSIKNNYFRSFKLPDLEDLYYEGGGMHGNIDLKPEDGFGIDIGAEYGLGEKFRLEASLFVQNTRDSIHWYNDGGKWAPSNVGEAVFFGFDSKLGGGFGIVELYLSYRYILSYLLSYGYDFRSDKRIPYMPSHSVAFVLKFFWNEFLGFNEGYLAFSGNYESARYADTANLRKINGIPLINASINQRLNRNFSVFIDLRNILNKSYESFSGYYMPPLRVSIGMRTNFVKHYE